MSILKAQVNGALGLTIPDNFAEETGIKPSSEVSIRRMGKTIVISVPREHSSLEDLLSQINETNFHSETQNSPASPT